MPSRLNTLWVGSSLGPVERACIRSMLRAGHALNLYCYRIPNGVPEGTQLCDAAEILPETSIVRYGRFGSPALFSNWFRYRLQSLGRGIWVDADVYLLRPIAFESDHLFGWQDAALINSAVLRLPPQSPLLPPLLALFEKKQVPFWLPRRQRLAWRLRRFAAGRAGLSDMPWGSSGPLAVTALARRYDLDHLALERDVFYPARWQDAAWIRDPSLCLEEVATPRTVAVHLWNELIRQWKDEPALPGSFLARLHREGC
jgi:hypothetical protein